MISNIFTSEYAHLYSRVPAIALFRISTKNLKSTKNFSCCRNKLKIIEPRKIFSPDVFSLIKKEIPLMLQRFVRSTAIFCFISLMQLTKPTGVWFVIILFYYITANRDILESAEPHRRSPVRSSARPIFFPRIDDSHCGRIHSSLMDVHCFDNGYVGKQPVAWKEYC